MAIPLAKIIDDQLLYPDSDGEPIADNTLQYQWIVTIQGNLDAMFRRHADVFVAGDLLWYPVQGKPKVPIGPDVLVAFGRPKGYRGSYKQWEEGGIAPQVVFEVMSPGNRVQEMDRKLDFYEKYGVEEYYIYDPYDVDLVGCRRVDGELQAIGPMHGFVSPLLGIRFDLSGEEMVIWGPDNKRFLTFVELAAEQEQERENAEKAQARAEKAQARAEKAQARADRLAARLRELGIDPES